VPSCVSPRGAFLNGLQDESELIVVAVRSCRPSPSEPKQRMDGTFSPAAILFAVLLTVALLSPAASLEPYDLLYDSAVQAFYIGDYTNVVRFMEGALGSYKEVRHTKVRCRLRCQYQHPFDGTFSDLRFADVVLRRAACMNTCIEENIGTQSVHKVSEDVVQDFQRRIPYNYLQLAYQKVSGEEGGPGGSQTSTLHGALVLSTPRGILNLAALRHFSCVSLPQLLLMRQRALGRSAAHVQPTPVVPVDSVVSALVFLDVPVAHSSNITTHIVQGTQPQAWYLLFTTLLQLNNIHKIFYINIIYIYIYF